MAKKRDETKSPILDPLGRKIPDKENPRPILVLADHILEYPELWRDVFVSGPPEEANRFAKILSRGRCWKADSARQADVVIFTGGPDVDPALYGAEPHPSTKIDAERDNEDITLYLECVENGIPMVGVCRGAQFLCVMNGGKLYQDIDNHLESHSMYDRVSKKRLEKISSVHHQAVMDDSENGMEIIATSANSKERWTDPKTVERRHNKHIDIEAFFYRDTCCLGVQGHPEYAGYNGYTKWFLELIDHYVNENPDLSYQEIEGEKAKHLRLKPELLEERGPKVFESNPIQE